MQQAISDAELAVWVKDARKRTFQLVADLADEQLLGPRLRIVNPLLWEIGHIAWFQEKWVLRHVAKQGPIRADVDALYDSAAVSHDTRWDLPFPSRGDTLNYMREVRDRVLGLLEKEHTDELRYFVMLSVFHEDMHGEAFIYTRQTLEYPAPVGLVREGNSEGVSYQDRFDGLLVPLAEIALEEPRAKRDDVYVPGGTFMLGATAGESFVFDNEKWAHPVAVKPFAIARAVVTQGDFAAFVEGGGYQREDFWCPQGWRWRLRVNAEHPVYWRRSPAGGWLRRDFERWLPLEMSRPVIHVNWFEADAYCRWAGRCLPREAEWEMAASTEPATQGIGERKRRFPWGDESPTPRRANLDGYAFGCVDVGFLREGNSAHGCCQLIGNVWEWTADDFLPYPGFVADPYKEYSAPWFGTHKVLRGGCWATRSRLIRNTWRNFYTPDRRDVWAGFRTCALQA